MKSAAELLARVRADLATIDLIVLATSTPDNTFPASAVSVQAELGITHGAAFDVQAVCSGFVFALVSVFAWPWILPEALNRWMDG